MNIGQATGFFSCERGTRQGDPLSAYLFISVLEILFIQVRSNQNISGLEIFGHEVKLTAFADDATYFISDIDSVKELTRLFKEFENFCSLKINYEKTEIFGMGVIKRASSGHSTDLTLFWTGSGRTLYWTGGRAKKPPRVDSAI